MKQLFTLALSTLLASAQAQVQNGGFEALNSEGFPAYWQGNMFLQVVIIDSTGSVTIGDSVVFDEANYLLNTTDVHSGTHAVELRNGYDFTTSTPIIGTWSASSDSSSYTGFPLAFVPVYTRPSAISFFSKFLPAESDSAFAEIHVYDEGFNEVGAGSLSIGGAFTVYTEFHVPVVYTAPDAAAFVSLQFATAKPGSTATLGTHFLIDDVQLLSSTEGVAEQDRDAGVKLYPVPAQDVFYISLPEGERITSASVVDLSGSVHALPAALGGSYDCSGLADGLYVVRMITGNGILMRDLVIAR